MKVAACLRIIAGAKAFCQLRSYLSTACKQGQTALVGVRTLRNGTPLDTNYCRLNQLSCYQISKQKDATP